MDTQQQREFRLECVICEVEIHFCSDNFYIRMKHAISQRQIVIGSSSPATQHPATNNMTDRRLNSDLHTFAQLCA